VSTGGPMPNKLAEVEYDEIYADDNDIGEDDYGFVFDSEGNVKFLFVPDNLPFKPPKNILKIMKILGVTDLTQYSTDAPLH
jgi:hypothetical protein